MKVIQVTRYVAGDGETFDTESNCVAYENKYPETLLIGLSASDVCDALEGRSQRLAAAIEAVGARLASRCIDPAERGRADFLSGVGGIVPEDLRHDRAGSEAWLAGWDEESVKAKARKAA